MGDSVMCGGVMGDGVMGEQPRVFRVHWVPGTDQLSGTCHCGAQCTASDPIELWDWLHGHPVGHGGGVDSIASATAPAQPRALVGA
jgi:hypothetical protein